MAMMTKRLISKMDTMSFDINAVLANAIKRGLTEYKNQLFSPTKRADWLKPQHASILKTIVESFNYPQLQPEGVQLFLDIFATFERWGLWSDYITVSEEAIRLDLPVEQLAYLHTNLGHMHHLNRNFIDSLHSLELSLQLVEEHQPNELLGLIHHRLMNTYIGLDKPEIAQEHGLQALALLGDAPSKNKASAYDSLGRIYTRLGNVALAEKRFQDALSLWATQKDYTHMARSYINLGYLFLGEDKLVEAQKCFESALKALGDLSNILDEVNARNGLGIVHYKMKDYDSAVTVFREAANTLERELGDNVGWYALRGMLIHNVGNALLAKGDFQLALVILNRSKTFWQQANDNLQMANTIGTIAEAYQADEAWETAVATYDEALTVLANFPNHPWANRLKDNFSKAKKTCAEQLEPLKAA